MDAVDEAIVRVIERITHPETGAYSRCFPRTVADFLPVRADERTIRRRMVRLASAGYIWRYPGRGGYASHDRAEADAQKALHTVMKHVYAVLMRYEPIITEQAVIEALGGA